MWFGVVWYGVLKALLPEGKGRDVLLTGIAKRAGVCGCVRAVCFACAACCACHAPAFIAPRQCGTVQRETHCPLPKGNTEVFCRRSMAHYPQAMHRCIIGVPVPAAHR